MKIKNIEDYSIENSIIGGEMVVKMEDGGRDDILHGIVDGDENAVVIYVEFVDVNSMNKLMDKKEGELLVYGDNPVIVRVYSESTLGGVITSEMMRYTVNRLLEIINNVIEFNDDDLDNTPEWYLVFDFNSKHVMRKDLKEFAYTISNTIEQKETDLSYNIIYLVENGYDFDIFDIEEQQSLKKKKKKDKKNKKKNKRN